MVSAIDPTKPVDGIPAVKSELRANLQTAKSEIEALQAAQGGTTYNMHRAGMLSEWLFAEGQGVTVADAVGSNDITLSAPPTSGWTTKGARLVQGIAESGQITGVRTVAALCRTTLDDTGGHQISGAAGTGQGIRGSLVPTAFTAHIGTNGGVYPLVGSATGTAAHRANRGGWVLLFLEYDQSYDTPLGFGGRHTTGTARCPEFEIAWAAAWDDVLTDAERQTVYEGARQIAARRGVYVTCEDCPDRVNMVVLWGQSNADGRGSISLLSVADQDRLSQPNVLIAAGDYSTNARVNPTGLVIGRNHKPQVKTVFGPEVGAAFRHDDASATQRHDLFISKMATGATGLQLNAIFASANGTWNVGELKTNPFSYYWGGLKALWAQEQSLLMRGIGPCFRALWWMQGERDSLDTAASVDYQTNLQALWDGFKSDINATEARMLVARIRDQSPTFDPAAVAQVRAAQSAFVTANPTDSVLIDTDGFELQADNLHFSEVGQISLGNAFHDNTDLLK